MVFPPPYRSLEEAIEGLTRDYRQLFADGQVVELRALAVQRGRERPHVESGFFETERLADLAQAALLVSPHARGVYATLNPVDPSLLARCANRLTYAGDGALAKDKDVLSRRWLLVDLDPVRDSLISATDQEKSRACEMAGQVEQFLSDRGWPAPLRADSGNGYHLLYRVDLPAEDDGRVKRVLQALASRFDSEQVHIDRSVFNPSRIFKLPGTLARKGDDIPTRPHRWARLLEESIP